MRDTIYFIVIKLSMTFCVLNHNGICRIPYENVSRTGLHNLWYNSKLGTCRRKGNSFVKKTKQKTNKASFEDYPHIMMLKLLHKQKIPITFKLYFKCNFNALKTAVFVQNPILSAILDAILK